jgi:hypothetical protein
LQLTRIVSGAIGKSEEKPRQSSKSGCGKTLPWNRWRNYRRVPEAADFLSHAVRARAENGTVESQPAFIEPEGPSFLGT